MGQRRMQPKGRRQEARGERPSAHSLSIGADPRVRPRRTEMDARSQCGQGGSSPQSTLFNGLLVLAAGDLDEMEAELRLHRAVDLAHLGTEHDLVELPDHLPRAELTE